MSRLKQIIFGTKSCDCRLSRKDGLHNMDCASWRNAWFPERLKRQKLAEREA